METKDKISFTLENDGDEIIKGDALVTTIIILQEVCF